MSRTIDDIDSCQAKVVPSFVIPFFGVRLLCLQVEPPTQFGRCYRNAASKPYGKVDLFKVKSRTASSLVWPAQTGKGRHRAAR